MPPSTQTTLEIPAGLRPADGRFGSGPSKVRAEQLARLAGDVDAEQEDDAAEADEQPGQARAAHPLLLVEADRHHRDHQR